MRRSLLVVVFSLAVAACGDAGSAAECTELREPEDPQSGLHVLEPGAATYLTDPPTSGPHVSGPTPAGVLDQPVDPAVQVRILESGGAMVQYRPDITSSQRAELESLAGSSVVVAPAATDIDEPIVATAWTWKLTCSTVAVDRLAAFIIDRPGSAPGID